MTFVRTAAGRGTIILFLALVLAGLLQAEGLYKQARSQPAGTGRTLALGVATPLLHISRALRLTVPRLELQRAIGRAGDDRIDERVRLALPPPAGPVPGAVRVRPRPQRPLVTRARPLRVWVGGDSLAQVPGDALARDGGNDVFVTAVESRLSTGLARPDLYNWFTRLRALMDGVRPQVAVLSFGADDAHDLMSGLQRGQSVGPFGSTTWVAEYRRRVEGVTRELNAAGIRTVWLGLPIPDGSGFRHSFPVVNRILRQVASRHAMSSYVDTWDMLASAHGAYTPYLRVHGRLTLMRLSDGVHYTPAAGDLIAGEILKRLHTSFRFG